MKRLTIPGLALALGITFTAANVSATPFASCLTNTGASITFRLNESADSVKIIHSGDTVTNDLGALPAGLTAVPLAVTGPYKVIVAKYGSGAISQLGASVSFNSPRGVAVNNNPASPYFGRVYVANSAAGTKGDGIYVFNADLSNPYSPSTNLRTAGYTWDAAAMTGAPFRLTVAPSDEVYVCDWSDVSGNLIATDPDVTSHYYVLKPIEANPETSTTGVIPVGSNNIHGSVQAVAVSGSTNTGDLVIYTVDEDYQQDPAAPFAYQMNSVWEYRIGSGPLPWLNPPDRIMAVPSVQTLSQNDDVVLGPSGYVYFNQRRANAGAATDSPTLFLVDTNVANYIDPTNYGTIWPSHPQWGGYFWDSQQASRDLGSGGVDYFGENNGVSVSPDGKYIAGIHYGAYNGIAANTFVIAPLSNGIPLLDKIFTFNPGSTIAAGRGIAWDRANNLYMISSGMGVFRAYTLGLTATAITGSDGTFEVILPAATVSMAATVRDASEAGPVSGQVTISRAAEDTSKALTVYITVAGTAVRGGAGDYVLKVGGVELTGNAVTIPAGAASVVLEVSPANDTESELTETVTLGMSPDFNYSVDPSARTATVAIVDNDAATADLAVIYPSMYERLSADYARLRVVRRGDTNAPSFTVNLSYSGSAATARYTAPATVTIDPGVVNQNFDVAPLDDALLNGNQTIVATVVSGAGYTVGTNSPSATATIVDDDLPAEDVLWSENFNTDVSANWTVQFNSGNGVNDYRIGGPIGSTTFSYDYASGGWFPAIPAAPRSTSDTLGLFLTVNKDEATTLGAAGINVYPNGQSFSGNYAVRFDMYLMVGNAASTTEYALFGINHSGSKPNWFRSGGVPAGSTFDGLFFAVEADGAALGDYVLYSAPTTAANNPTALTPGVNAATLTGIFKNPPFGGGLPGAPGNSELSTTPSWADVEISQVGGVVTLTINRTPIMSYTNTTSFTSGNIMLGYCDAYDSIMAGNSVVVYDNLRVIRLASTTPPNITRIQVVGGDVEIYFTADASDTPAAFTLQAAGTVNGTYGDTSAAITGSSGSFKAVRALSGDQQFYRLKRN
jgi:hypothetical protein